MSSIENKGRNMNEGVFRLLIVGGGITGCMTASLIKQYCPRYVDIHIWEKSKGIGGRMTTNRSNNGQTIDLGAQYITQSTQYLTKHQKYFDDLIKADILKPFHGLIDGVTDEQHDQHFMVPKGINSIAKHYLTLSEADVDLHTLCRSIELCSDKKSWKVFDGNERAGIFHGLILTMPVPQILTIDGHLQDLLSEYRSELEAVQYSSRYALGLYFEANTQIKVPWTAKYIKNHPCLRFVCIDSLKRQDKSGCSVLVHTTVPFGLQHLETDINEIKDTIYEFFKNEFPEFPRPLSMRCIRWRYSQVHQPFARQPGSLLLRDNPFLVLAGDAFVHSNFSGCIESALSVLEKFRNIVSS